MHFSTSVFLAFAASASAYSATKRTYAVNHFYGKGPLVMGRMDPIISPGVVSGHVHAVQGGNGFALTMTDDQALNSTCTSALVRNDKSNYWTPSLYFHAANGSFISVPMFYMNVYYFFDATTDKIEAFQPGHRMVIGNVSLRTPPATGGTSITDLSDGTPQPVQWICPRSNTTEPLYPPDSDGLHGVGIQDPTNTGAGVGFPDQYCDGYASPMRADIHFPSCYDPSKGLDNYKENMVWPTKGNCPEGFIHVPHLFYEVYWNTPLFSDEWTAGEGTQPWVLANGDPTGYSLHADFISGWDVDTLQQIIDNCDSGDSGMDKCPGLIGGLNDPSTSCNIECPIHETILGVLEELPGNNPLGQWGVPPAGGSTSPASSAAGNVAAASTTVTSAADVVNKIASAPSTLIAEASGVSTPASSSSEVASGWSYYGCYSDFLVNRVMSGIKFADLGAVTNTKCVAYCASKGYDMAGSEFGGQCFCANALASTSSPLAASACNMPCQGDASQTCGGGLALSVYSKSVENATGFSRTNKQRLRNIRRGRGQLN